MIKNSLIIILILFSSFLLYLLYKEPSRSEREKALSALYDSRAAVYLHGLNQDKVDKIKILLEFDTVHLIHEYDRELFTHYQLNKICKDWGDYLKDIVVKHLAKHDDGEYQVKYYQQVKLNMQLLNNCKTEN